MSAGSPRPGSRRSASSKLPGSVQSRHDPLLAAEAAIERKRAGDLQHAAARCSPDAQRLLHRLMINITREPAQSACES